MIRILLSALLLAAPVVGSAEVDCKEQYKAWLKASKDNKDQDAPAVKKAAKDRDACEAKRYKSISDCKQNEKDYGDTVKKVQQACNETQIKEASESGSIACLSPKVNCNCLNKNNNGETAEKLGCTEPPPPELKFCPQSTNQAAELNEKKLDKTDTRVEKLRDKIRSLEDDKVKSSNDKTEKRRASREAKAKALETFQQAVAQAEETASNNQKAMYEQLNNLQKEMLTANQGVTDANIKDSAAFSALQEQNMRIELECAKRATGVVNGRVTEAIAGIKTGTFNRGDQTNLFRQVGLTDRQSWQQQAKLLKRQCMEDEDTHASFASASRAYAETKKVNAEARRLANDNVEIIKQNMRQLQNPGGCTAAAANGVARVTQACADAAMVQKKLAAAQTAKKAAEKAANQQFGEDMAAAQKVEASKDAQITAAKSELDEYEKRLAALKEAEKAHEGYPNAGGMTTQARALDVSTLEMQDRAGRINFCCGKSPNEISPNTCTAAQEFMERRGFDVKATSVGTSSTARPTTTTPTEPTGAGGSR